MRNYYHRALAHNEYGSGSLFLAPKHVKNTISMDVPTVYGSQLRYLLNSP